MQRMRAAPSSVVRISPTSAWPISSARKPASNAVNVIANHFQPSRFRVSNHGLQRRRGGGAGERFGSALASLGGRTSRVGLAASCSPV
jgi:hypothetical protein